MLWTLMWQMFQQCGLSTGFSLLMSVKEVKQFSTIKLLYYMAGSASCQDEALIGYLAHLGLPALFLQKQNNLWCNSFGNIINLLLTKLVQSRWQDNPNGSFFLCIFIDLNFISVHKNTKKNLANIQPS